ncbi:MAG TPA: diguanylate cyclase, partial [Ignavibacteriaceae bacterium]
MEYIFIILLVIAGFWHVKAKKKFFEFILSSFPLPLIFVNSNGEIVHKNSSFNEFIESSDCSHSVFSVFPITENDFKELFSLKQNSSRIFHCRVLDSWKTIEVYFYPIFSGFVFVCIDRTIEYKSQLELKAAMSVDALTGLPNRIRMRSVLENQIEESNGLSFPVLFADLDHFKRINDISGHTVGDEFLLAVSERFYEVAQRNKTMISRFGGEEFVFLMPLGSSDLDAERLSNEILRESSAPVFLDEKELISGISIGISMYPQDGKDVDTILKNADMALHVAKHSGRATSRFFDMRMSQENEKSMQIEHWIRQEFARGGSNFTVHLQPQFSMKTGKLCGAEALM